MGKIQCVKYGIETKKVFLENYEYEEGISIRRVPALKCPKCGEFIFTEKQVEEMERKIKVL